MAQVLLLQVFRQRAEPVGVGRPRKAFCRASADWREDPFDGRAFLLREGVRPPVTARFRFGFSTEKWQHPVSLSHHRG
jgi:hypothetical protein